MVDDKTKNKAVIEFEKKLDKICKEIDQDYKELLSLSLSLEDILKKIEKYTLSHEIQWRKLENELFIPYELTDRINIAKARQRIVFSDSDRGLTSISLALKKIKKSNCNQCQKQLTKDNCYVYFWKNKNIVKWIMEKAKNFSSKDFNILFCSPNCFQKSIYSKQTNKKATVQNKTKSQSNQQLKNELSQLENKIKERASQRKQLKKELQEIKNKLESEPLYCSECHLEITSKSYYFHKSKNDHNKFCSQNCFTNFYHGEFCHKCYNKFPKWELKEFKSLISEKLLCGKCYEEEKENQKQFEDEIKYCQFCQKQLESGIQSNSGVCHNDKCLDKYWEEKHRGVEKFDGSEQVNIGNQNSPYSNQNLLKEKRKELRDLENQLKESNLPKEQKDNFKLIMWIGGGLLVIGLISLIIYLFIKNRRKE